MKKLVNNIIKTFRRACHICHGMGVIELPNGDTKECVACKGTGSLK